MTKNQNPEQRARDNIDKLLRSSGWLIQEKNKINLEIGDGQAVKEYQTDVGPADYVLFVNKKAIGIIEAKREEEGQRLTQHETQTESYASANLKWLNNKNPLPFLYESTGIIVRFTDGRDPRPRSREVFNFHQPKTLAEWIDQDTSLAGRLDNMPLLNPDNKPASILKLRDCQELAISNLEKSFKESKPRALIQMATGAGKTYTAITSMYRLIKYGEAKRILFLVDTKNLGEQAEQEMFSYNPLDDNRKFTELYNVQRLKSSYLAKDSQVCISTIQRLYSILKDKEMDEKAEEINPAELIQTKEPLPIVYNKKIPPEFFDFIFIDECHRSIYNLWQQVLDYFDAKLIGLTATPDNRTYGFFKKNIVSDYSHEKAVADGVNVGNEIYIIDTAITQQGGKIKAKQHVEKRERLSRKKRWEQQDEDEEYSSKQLDRDIVNPDQIRTILRTFKEQLPEIFPERKEVPKTLIFAKTDSHADDIIQTVREEFGEGNAFCKKLTYKVDEDTKSILSQFRNSYNPRIAVTVDMIATGTDVKPLECLLFMRDIKSKNYFEQMKGRGTRTLNMDDLRKVTPSARSAKTHYVIVDAIGVTKSLKTASQPIITKPSVPLKDLGMSLVMGSKDEDIVSSFAGRLARLNKQLNDEDKKLIREFTGGIDLSKIISKLFDAIDPDNIESRAKQIIEPNAQLSSISDNIKNAKEVLIDEASKNINGEFIELIDNIRKSKEQIIDHETLDTVTGFGWDKDISEKAQNVISEFCEYLNSKKDEIDALEIFFNQPFRRRDVTFEMINKVFDKLKSDKPNLAPIIVWQAYQKLDNVKNKNPISELTALISLIRRVCGIDKKIQNYSEIVNKNFMNWIMKHHSGNTKKFNQEQMEWLRMMRDHISTSFHIENNDFNIAPFDRKGGLGKFHELFGSNTDFIIKELNQELVA